MPKFVASFNEIDKDDVHLVGEKAAALGELVHAGFPILPGFVITSAAYHEFLKENKLDVKINHLLSTIDFASSESIRKVSSFIKNHIQEAQIPQKVVGEIIFAYNKLGGKIEFPLVTIESSEEIVSVKGDAALLEKIKECWSSHFSDKTIIKMHEQKHSQLDFNICLVIQKTLNTKSLGVMFTNDPRNNDKSKMILEMGSERLELGRADFGILNKHNLKIKNSQITELASLAERIEKQYYFPQEIDWAIENEKIYILRIKPMTSLPKTSPEEMVVHDYYDSDQAKKQNILETATKLYLNLTDLKSLEALAEIDGVGILEPKFLFSQTHPKGLIKSGKKEDFVSKLSHDLAKVCKGVDEKPVIYKLSDFKTNEYQVMLGGKQFEPEEINPTLGFRGAFRHLHEPEVFMLELQALKIARNEYGCKNLHLLIPFVRTVEELKEIKELVSKEGLERSTSFQVWMEVEVPSNLIMLENFIGVGIDGVLIDADNLAMLIMGTDRGNFELANEQIETYPAVLWAFEHVVKTANKHSVHSSIFGKSIPQNRELVSSLISWGISAVFVSEDEVGKARKLLAENEKELLNKN